MGTRGARGPLGAMVQLSWKDGAGTKKLFHHAVDDDGQIHRYWLEAEESRHQARELNPWDLEYLKDQMTRSVVDGPWFLSMGVIVP